MRWRFPLTPMACRLSLGLLFFVYLLVQIRNALNITFLIPPVERFIKEAASKRLPRLWLCPADRQATGSPLRWRSFECGVGFRDKYKVCSARIQQYRGRAPSEFRGKTLSGSGGECLEFDLNEAPLKEEWSASWSQATLRASFSLASASPASNFLREVEIGYEPVEWELGDRQATQTSYYYPLARVPFYWMASDAPHGATGVATRAFIQTEHDKGRRYGGEYWYLYGVSQISVENGTIPIGLLSDSGLRSAVHERLGVVHVILTLDDFEKYEYREASPFFPLIGIVGQVAGVAALALIAIVRLLPAATDIQYDPERVEHASVGSASPRYAEVATEDEEGHSRQALLRPDEALSRVTPEAVT